MRILTSVQRRHFDEEGYVVVKDVLDPTRDIAPWTRARHGPHFEFHPRQMDLFAQQFRPAANVPRIR